MRIIRRRLPINSIGTGKYRLEAVKIQPPPFLNRSNSRQSPGSQVCTATRISLLQISLATLPFYSKASKIFPEFRTFGKENDRGRKLFPGARINFAG